jgi:hypothetical protein
MPVASPDGAGFPRHALRPRLKFAVAIESVLGLWAADDAFSESPAAVISQINPGPERCIMNDNADLGSAMTELNDAFARVRAQVHVLRMAMGGIQDERDIRALIFQLGTIEEELQASERMLKKNSPDH